MEFLEGFDLDTLVRRFGPVAPERAIHFLEHVCHSLAEAHASGLVHRDIKPANVYVCRYGRDVDFVKVLDFGLVKSGHDVDGATQLSLTADHAARGTPAFMSPEQVLGDRPMDGRSDIYATGCLAYWLVTGQHVFAGRTAMETMVQHTQKEPVPPSQRSGRPVPAGLDDVILECLAKDPGRRPPAAEALAARLAAIHVPDPWTQERARAWWDVNADEPASPVSAPEYAGQFDVTRTAT
jgi:serine/threonine-protein kinase